jgi:TPR repeat protein
MPSAHRHLPRWRHAAAALLLCTSAAHAIDFAAYQRQRDNTQRYQRMEDGARAQMLQQTLAGNAARAAERDRRFQDFYRAVQEEEASRRQGRSVDSAGLSAARSPAQLVAELRRLAEGGDAAAARALGQALSTGTGTAVDKAGAARWFARAADGGDTVAQAIWGSMLAFGSEGVARNPAGSIRYLRAAAESGDAMAMSNLAFAHLRGHGLPENESEAVGWFRRAAAAGSVEGKLGWGDALVFGKAGTPRNMDEGLRLLREAAAAGNSDARLLVGGLAANGRVPGMAAGEGAQMVLAAARSGHAQAQRLFGTLALEGSGTPRSPSEAVRWFEPLARDGDGIAAWYLCAGWLNGQIGREPARSRPWCEKAAQLGHPDGIVAWGEHLKGQHVGTPAAAAVAAAPSPSPSPSAPSMPAAAVASAPPPLPLAEALDLVQGPLFLRSMPRGAAALRQLAEAGDAAAQYHLAELLSGYVSSPLKEDEPQALDWYRRAAQAGNRDAQARLGIFTARGQFGLPADPAAGQRMLQEAADAGSAVAMRLLAVAHAQGYGGLAKDRPAAARWARASAEAGDRTGMVVWHFLLRDGVGVAADPAEALKWLNAAIARDAEHAWFYMGRYLDPYQRDERIAGVQKDIGEALRHYEIASRMGHAGAAGELRTAKAREQPRAAAPAATTAGAGDSPGRDTFIGALRAARDIGMQMQDVNESSLRATLARSHDGVPVSVNLSVYGRRVSADIVSRDDAVRAAYIRALRERLQAHIGGVILDGNVTWR